jgi:hypothetical protein
MIGGHRAGSGELLRAAMVDGGELPPIGAGRLPDFHLGVHGPRVRLAQGNQLLGPGTRLDAA